MWVTATICVRGDEQLLEFVEQEIAVVVDRSPSDHRALALAQEMPRHDVGMVLHDREHDLVAGLDALAAEGVGDEIDGFGGIAGEDDLFLASGVEKRADLVARALIGLGRRVGEVMQAAMDVGIFGSIGVIEAVENGSGFLRGGGVVEIDQRLAVNRQREDRKILADAGDVVGAVVHCGMHVTSSLPSQAATWSINASRRPACSIPSIASPTKA